MGLKHHISWAFAGLALALSPMAVTAKPRPEQKAPSVHKSMTTTDAAIARIMKLHNSPGAAVMVMRNGKVIAQKGYGLANVEHNVPVTPKTMFQTGSVAKMFTASAALRLAEQGKWKLSDPICRYLVTCPDTWKGITFDQLIRHSSGIPDYEQTSKTGELIKAVDYRKDYTDADFLRIAQDAPLTFKPGTAQEYSNTGYVVLGILINRVTGIHYSDYLTQEIFKPAGMSTARLLSDPAIVPNRAAGYEVFDGSLRNQSWNSESINSTADGSLYLSLNDYAAWIRWLPKEGANSALYKAANTIQKLADGSDNKYDGLGWVSLDDKGTRIKEKTGQWQGFRAYTFWVPTEEFAVVLLINACTVDKNGVTTDPGILESGRDIVRLYRTNSVFTVGG